MHSTPPPLVGIGLYSVGEAARLSGVHGRTIRRWIGGYRYRREDRERSQPPVWDAALVLDNGRIELTFLDLMEVRFVREFRKHGVSWAAIREAAHFARNMYEDRHPFTHQRFRTDGKSIFERIESQGGVKLFDLKRKNWVFREIVEPSLYSNIEFENERMARWFPYANSRLIVVDPALSFGRPTLTKEGIATEILAAECAANDNDEAAVARWYGISKRAVRAAVEYHGGPRTDLRIAA